MRTQHNQLKNLFSRLIKSIPYIILAVSYCFALVKYNVAFAIDDILDEQTVEFSENYDKRLRYTPSTVLIYDRDYIEKSGVLTVAELMERVIGIHMTRKPYGASSNQYIRGIDSNLLVLHNGVENAKLIPELLALPVIDLERVEVVKGSHYPLYGASAVAGTINLVTTRVRDNQTRVGVRAGTLDTNQAWALRSDRIDQLGYSAYISHTQTKTTDGIIDADLQSFVDLQAGSNLSLAPRDGFFDSTVTDARLTLEFGSRWVLHQFVNHREFGTGVGMAQTLDPTGEEAVTYYSADLRFEDQVGKGVFEARLTYNFVDMAYNDLTGFPPGAFGGALPDGLIQKRYSKIGHDIFAEGLYRIAFGRNTLDIGAGGSYAELNNESDIRNYAPVPGTLVPMQLDGFVELSDTNPLFGGDTSVDKAHFMLRNEFKVTNNIFFNAGGRIDYSSDIGTHLIPRIGLSWVAGQNTNVGILYGESVQAPSEVVRTSQGAFFAEGDDELKPERIQLLELSMDHRFNNNVSVIANLYTFRLNNTIAIVDNPEVANANSFVNLNDDEKGNGAELLVSWEVNKNAKVSAGFSAVEVNSADESIATSPRFEPYLEFNYLSPSRYNTNIAVIGVADRTRREGDQREKIDDYAVLNLSFRKSDVFTQGMDLNVSVQNLFDEDAREDIGDVIPSDLPVYPRRIVAGVTYRFD